MKEYLANEFYRAGLVIKHTDGCASHLQFDEALTFNEAKAQVEGAQKALALYGKDEFPAGGIIYRCQFDSSARGGFIVCDVFREDVERLVWLKIRG